MTPCHTFLHFADLNAEFMMKIRAKCFSALRPLVIMKKHSINSFFIFFCLEETSLMSC